SLGIDRTALADDAAAAVGAAAGALRGRVTTAAGDPIAAAQVLVRASWLLPTAAAALSAEDPLDAASLLAEAATDYLVDLATRREARTDAEGRFEVAGLPRGRYELLVEADGYLPYRRWNVELGDVDVRLEAGARVACEVRLPD